jgi:hypothetical protein
MSTLERAIAIASSAHEGQREKSGSPYILHPLRVMLAMRTIDEGIAAVLHDVVEDTSVTLVDLEKERFPPLALEAVRLLTHAESIPYMDYIRSVCDHPIARAVKMGDLRDNLDLSRLPVVTADDEARLARYREALSMLESL